MLGCIADDVTGATDAAALMSRHGANVSQVLGIPTDLDCPKSDAVVVALKTRTIPPNEAIEQSLQAAKWLLNQGATQIYFKYCSTFDSSPTGNIGPVALALASYLNLNKILYSPAFPQNGRTVFMGHLFVGEKLISETGMARHPLTPMTDPDLKRMLSPQLSNAHVDLLPLSDIRTGRDKLLETLNQCGSHVIADAVMDEDLQAVSDALFEKADSQFLLTGGSAFAGYVIKNNLSIETSTTKSFSNDNSPSNALILSGSCSEATLKQVEFVEHKIPVLKLHPADIFENADALDKLVEEALEALSQGDLLISSSSSPIELLHIQSKYGAAKAGELIESIFGTIAQNAVNAGISTIIVAGGETSGAVAKALSVKSLKIGPEIAPGVPWTQSLDKNKLMLAFKSGNFGEVSFFDDALSKLREMTG